MPEIDVIREIAKSVLTVPTLSGKADNRLWDRTRRLLRNVEHICRLGELAQSDLAVDRFCLTIAAYFAEAGLTRYVGSEEMLSRVVLADVSESDLLDLSSQVAADKLSGVVDAAKIDKVNKIIVASGNRFTNVTEAMIFSDARSLDDMGAVGIFNEFRRCVAQGKGVSDALEGWQKKIDYGYFQARLKESFRFESVRKLAEQRLAFAEYFMKQLAVENSAGDLAGNPEEQIMVSPAGAEKD